MKKVLLLLLTISVTTMAQEVSFIINDVKEYVSSSNHETTSFADLQTWDNPGNYWGMHYRYNVKKWTNLGDALPLTSDEACIFDMRHNGSNYAGESVHWFTIQCVTPSYTRAVYELKYRLKSYHYHNSTAHRTAYFDYNNDANGYWKNRNKTPDGQTYFNTASKETFNTNTTNKETYTYSGEAAAVRISGYLSGNYSTQCYDALYSLPEVEIDNRLNTTENTYKRYGAISASKMKASVSNDKVHYTNVNMAYTVKALYCYKYLTYKANGGTGEDQTQTIENAGTTKAANTFSREGYVFSKWTTNADGTGTAYEANAAIEATLDSKGPVTLYAQWTSTLVPTTYIDENGVEQTIDAWEITNASEVVTWGVAGETTWYVVKGTDVQLIKGAVCLGDVHLILADGAKLTATGAESNAGIQVSGAENSLAIYGQINQSGQLIAEGGDLAAGIGGGAMASGSNITINGGTVEATGGEQGAGIGGGNNGSGENITINGGVVTATGGDQAAGIGGGEKGSGSNITINGGIVEATGGESAAAIGNGDECESSASNIFVATNCLVKADGNNPPTTVIANDGSDLASSLAGKQYATVEPAPGPATLSYTRDVTNGDWGTICLPWASVALEGGTFYDVLGTKDPTQGVALTPIEGPDQLTAGKPYVFRATSEQIKVTYNPSTEVTEEVAGNNIIGSFDGCNVPEGKYIIVNNLLYKTADATSTIAANRAYFDVDAMNAYTPSQAPGRKVVFMGGRTMPTELETVDGSQCTMHNGKFIMNGRFVIVRDGKMYNALGM